MAKQTVIITADITVEVDTEEIDTGQDSLGLDIANLCIEIRSMEVRRIDTRHSVSANMHDYSTTNVELSERWSPFG